jgi:hypothetical protein
MSNFTLVGVRGFKMNSGGASTSATVGARRHLDPLSAHHQAAARETRNANNHLGDLRDGPCPRGAGRTSATDLASTSSGSFPPIEALRPPAGAPTVLIILIDDCGFRAASVFGGPCATPTAERLAASGLKYNRLHTTALCSPTRQALLTGRNHHSVGMGGITEMATSAPGYSSVRPNTAAPLAETLRLNGYSTAQFGKCHEVPVWETSPMGPFDSCPTGGGGFEHFFGFLGGETNQYAPASTTQWFRSSRTAPPRRATTSVRT